MKLSVAVDGLRRVRVMARSGYPSRSMSPMRILPGIYGVEGTNGALWEKMVPSIIWLSIM